jgi:hydroxylamine dehydrogenase
MDATHSARQRRGCRKIAGSAIWGRITGKSRFSTNPKHGIQYHANLAKMNLDSKSWVVGRDYSAAPTCATCHMSATPNQAVTHDVGDRISITLRPVISTKLDNWERRRVNMMDVCSNCHASGWLGHFLQAA